MGLLQGRVGRVRRVRRIVVPLAAALACVAALGCTATTAGAQEPPSWRIVSIAEPTNLVKPEGEIDELKVNASEGSMLLIVDKFQYFIFLPYNVSATEMQAALEAELGEGNVEVAGGPGDATGSKPYVITFTGALTGREVGIFAAGLFPNETEGAKVKVVRKGADGGSVLLTAINVGGPTDGTRISISDSLPPQLVPSGEAKGYEQFGEGFGPGAPIACKGESSTFTCTYSGVMEPGDALKMRIPVKLGAEDVTSVVNRGSVTGGGAEHEASVQAQLPVNDDLASFGVAPGSVVMASSSRQAGAHPDVTTSFGIATHEPGVAAGNLRDVRADLPPGLVGNTVGMPQCPAALALAANCPRDTIVGVASTTIVSFHPEENFNETNISPIYNIEPSPGEPAAFMFTTVSLPVRLDTSVLSDGDYAVRVSAEELSEASPVFGSSVTIWGIPAEHEGPGPIKLQAEGDNSHLEGGLGGPLSSVARVPLLTNPTQCVEPLTGTVAADGWEAPGLFSSESVSLGTIMGCGSLAFSGSMSMLPDTLEAGVPAGYDFKLHVPQTNNPDGLAQPYVKKVVTALPMGTVISPSAAVGLGSCSDEQFFGPAAERGLAQPAKPASCPRDSQVGTVEIRTPALPLPLTGDVYLAAPPCDPCSPQDAQQGKMIRLFVQVVGEGQSGIVVKLAGHVSVNQQTGQLTATFDNDPQLPFSDFRLKLAGGSRATLANPRTCGPVATSLDMTPWSSPFGTDLTSSSTFEIDQACIAAKFAPSFVAGTTNIQAGEYTPFTLSFGRRDSDEFLDGLQMQMPAGLLGSLRNVPLCKEPQAATGNCSEDSLIGHTQVLLGPGQTPFLVTGGRVFLTEGYKGAPFGLSIVVPAKAGPFTLTGTTGAGAVVVRAAINVDPHSAALTITSDPLPTALDGIPLQLKVVNVTIDRPDFMLNPTSCAKMAITGTLSSQESGGAHVSSPFQVTNCTALGFEPHFTASTSGRTSRADGASLDVKLTYPKSAKYANVAKVKVELPRQLPSRLSTLQKACPAATFDANPSLCPQESIVGIARAATPILPVTLTGPAYFVSHGGEAFPNLILVLQGYGVRVDLVGDTFISKKGITSSTFNQVPDVPIESFELYLPRGRNSALAANADLCAQTATRIAKKKMTRAVDRRKRKVRRRVRRRTAASLAMPTVFTAQNGAVVHRDTRIEVTGCAARTSRARARSAPHGRRQADRSASASASDMRDAGTRRGK